MHVLVMPGGTSPYGRNSEHRLAYESIVSELRNLKQGVPVQIVTYPGQVSKAGKRRGELRFSTSLAHVLRIVQKSGDSDLRMFGSCYGAAIAAAVCAAGGTAVSKAAFWAPLPFWKTWEVCVLSNALWAGHEEERGVVVTDKVLGTAIPFELSIQRIKDTKCLVSVGTMDKYVGPATLDYFRTLVSGRPNFEFCLIDGMGHVVGRSDANWQDFSKRVLKWLIQ